MTNNLKLCLLMHDLRGGGAERVVVRLCNGLAQAGCQVDLVLIDEGSNADYTPPSTINVVDLAAGRTLSGVFAFAKHLRQHDYDAVISHMTHINVASCLAKALARSQVPLLLIEHNQISLNAAKKTGLMRLIYQSTPWTYRLATHVAAVSDGVRQTLSDYTGWDPSRIGVLYNPVVAPSLQQDAANTPEHPWFCDDGVTPFFAAGRLNDQKNFALLVDAFATAFPNGSERLVIAGEGDLRPELQAQINRLGLCERVDLPGFMSNPFACMARAKAFVLSSNFEGLPTVLIEALASGAPVISTDCPSGPSEIILSDSYGMLVPVGDCQRLADAFAHAASRTWDRNAAKDRGMDFTDVKSVNAYLETVKRMRK